MRTMRMMVWAMLIVSLAGCGQGGEAGGGWPVTQVALAKVEFTQAPRALHGVGELEAIRQIELAAEASGRITRIAFSSGQAVKAGQLLVQINDAPEQAEARRLVAQLRNSETLLARMLALRQQQVVTEEQLDNATAARDMAQSELQRMRALIAQKAVHAPFSGVVGIARVHLGQHLSAGEAIASLVDATSLHVNFALPEQALAQIRRGQAVEISVDAWPDEVFSGEITAIDPWVTSARTLKVQARVQNSDGRLQAGMFANARVLMPEPAPVLVVPETAVTYTSYGQSVFVAEAGAEGGLSVRRVLVETGQRWQGLVEITAHLAEGQEVVVSGQLKLADGMAVVRVAGSADESAGRRP